MKTRRGLATTATICVLALAIAGCTESDKPSTSSSKQPDPKCADTGEQLSVAEDGWSITSAKPDTVKVSFGAVMENTAKKTITSAMVDIKFYANGKAVDYAGGIKADEYQTTRGVSAIRADDTVAITGSEQLAAKPDSVKYTVSNECSLPAKDAEDNSISATKSSVDIKDSKLSADIALDSSYPDKVDVSVAVIFRDKKDKIVGGAPTADGNSPDSVIRGVPAGKSKQQAKFDVAGMLPDSADAARTDVYVAESNNVG